MKYINKHRTFFVLILTFLFTLSVSYAKSVGNDISNSVFRLHIVANSNSAEDQALKLLVRDRLLKDTASMFENSSSAEDSAKIAVDNLSEICRIANDEIIKNGFHYCVNATVDKLSFPTKTYGDISLPSGRYMALRIEIGSGKGENWWCVMYPPLCLTDGILSCPDESKNKLKSSLTDEEYRLVTKEDSDRLPVEIRFKIVEIFQKLF